MERKYLWRALGVTVVLSALFAASARADVFNMPAGQTSLLMVPVGNPGNDADAQVTYLGTVYYGAVSYTYNIGKYEVTAGQYKDFLSAVGGVDTHTLYHADMSGSYGCGITRSGGGTVGNPYTYAVDANYVNRPVNCVSFWDACRFSNWLQNGQPSGAQNAGTTEDGAYTLTNTLGVTNNTITRNAGTTWAVSSEDEWYKAAYYDPATGGYFLYPTRSNNAPGNNLADPLGNNANVYTGTGGYPIDSGIYTTNVGQFANSASPYGTFDQAGNVYEWNEAIVANVGSFRAMRGGMFGVDGSYTRSSWRINEDPNLGYNDFGFRVVQVPETASLILLALGAVGLFWRRRKAV